MDSGKSLPYKTQVTQLSRCTHWKKIKTSRNRIMNQIIKRILIANKQWVRPLIKLQNIKASPFQKIYNHIPNMKLIQNILPNRTMNTSLKTTTSLNTLPSTMISPQFQKSKQKLLRLHTILTILITLHLTIIIALHLTIQYKLPLQAQAHITLINQLKILPWALKRRKPFKPQ